MMRSSPETTTRTTGAHRAHRGAREARDARREARENREEKEARDRAAARTVAQRTPARYEPYLDGLFTYCLSVLCDHDTATAALGEVLALAERRGHRAPGAPGDLRAWLYALARWACLRKLAEAKQKRQATHAAGRGGAGGAGKGADGGGGRKSDGAGRGRPAGTGGAGAGADRAAGAAGTAGASGDAGTSRADGTPGTSGEAGTSWAHGFYRAAGSGSGGPPAGAQWPSAAGSSRAPGRTGKEPPASALPPDIQEQRRRELALLAWPEAAGTTPEQREALELAVRHHLATDEVAAVLGMEPAAARELLASAACEVERTRAALAVVETGGCPSVAHLTGDNRLVLSTALRRELVRHVDDCPRCRRTAERAVPGHWPGATVTPAELPVLEAPRTALARHPRARGAAVPRFDRRGFPMDPKDRAARRDRIRARAVTTTVVATVVAAPVLALWAAYRGGPAGDDDGRAATAREAQGPEALGGDTSGGYENAGNASVKPGVRMGRNGKADVSVEVVSVGGMGGKGAGQLDVSAANDGDTTLITLTASGASEVRWSVSTSAGWLYFSQSAGTLEPGRTLTVKVYVDHLREPSGHWHARVAVAPAGAVVSIDGYGTAPSRPTPPPASPTPPSPPPSTPPTEPPATQSPPPTDPTPTPTTPPPSDTPTPTPTPTDTETPAPTDS
ncbi:BACON domain-containing protein [Streptomyces flaveolus]|uniref:BACON domain-containing protein n=1 Tax=Streptomyces flaveolus TaxID=67297 RepID=UPI0033F38302